MSDDEHFLTELQRITSGSKSDTEPRSSELNDFISLLADEHSVQLTLSGDHGYSQSKSLPFSGGSCSFPDITPGKYQLTLSNGRMLWQGELKKEYLILENDIPLKMAADTELDDADASTFFELIPSECKMFVFPGLELGSVKINTM